MIKKKKTGRVNEEKPRDRRGGRVEEKGGVKGRIEDDSTAQRGRCTNTQTLRVITARRATHRRRGRE